ncbi:hypothetical protein PR003_g11117 [Phytophthora rubi]|uniref:Uncharacterized protein n=1 Tax=Phytophthora rubi TaxID=129364 RepID=A0A6A3NM97_9STRA|nr:hypothetical protein PR002_g2122 [Phytophthora rubi]KAE9050460.1 hypothetical protein PR001_g2368 [Phytophthora rubi]KAE9339229.1 hypothetical protein PR003_g11117 [Phytophthora rubi]
MAVRLNKELDEIKQEARHGREGTVRRQVCRAEQDYCGLEKTFGGGVPEGAGGVPLKELMSKFSGYKTLGSVTNGDARQLHDAQHQRVPRGEGSGRWTHGKLPGTLSATGLAGTFQEECKWLDSSVSGYVSFVGISLARPTMAATPGAVAQKPIARTAPGRSSSDDPGEPLSDSDSHS